MSDPTTSATPRPDRLSDTPLQDELEQRESLRLSEAHSLPPGQAPGYEIERLLGEGAYGSVWLARELKTGKHVAIKFYTQRRGLNWSLLSREVEKLAVLYTSRNIVGLLDVGWDHDPPYFVMEYLEAGSLDSKLRDGPIPIAEAVSFAKSIARALVHAHRSGVLHCDLKPANILLDVNSEPRLGDFGQSRLTTEQSPALGTLFYMAPEQAVVDAVPDLRWDVYALGAVLYHMVTGSPPYWSPESEARLREARDMHRRLQVYRDIVLHSPSPEAHRMLPGVDLRLADLIDGCLQRDPAQRLPNVQHVLDLLEERDQARAKRPLIALGFLGPILFLLAMYWIAESVVPRIVSAAEQNLVDRALGGDVLSARLLAESVHQELHSRQDVLERWAEQEMLRTLVTASAGLTEDQLLRLCTDGDDGSAAPAYAWLRSRVREAEERLNAEGRTLDDSWFVTDAHGKQIFRYPPRDGARESTLGRPFHWRDYFHGRGMELDPSTPVDSIPPRTAAGVSTAFRSQANDQYMVAIAMPLRGTDGAVIGVLARTIRLTALLQQWDEPVREVLANDGQIEDSIHARFLVLADTRGDGAHLLDHPGMTQAWLAERNDLELQSASSPLRLSPQIATSLQQEQRTSSYTDPMGAVDPTYQGTWLAAAAPVGDTGWLAIVQERRDTTVQPVDNLRRVLVRAGFWSLGIFSALLLLLWHLIQRAAG